MNWLRQSKRYFGPGTMPVLFILLLITACGGAKSAPTSVPLTSTPFTASATNSAKFQPIDTGVGSGSPQTTTSTSVTLSSQVYTDPQSRFSIAILPGFQQQATTPGTEAVSFIAPRLPGIGYNVQVDDVGQKIGPNGTVDDIATIEVKNASASKDYVPDPAGVQPTTLGGKPARMFTFALTDLGQHLRAEEVIALIGPLEYAVTFNARDTDFDTYASQRVAVLGSFTFLANTTTYRPALTATASSAPMTFHDPQGRVSFIVPAGFRQLAAAEPVPGLSFNIGTVMAVFASATDKGMNFNADTEAIQDGTQPADLDRVVAGLRARLPKESKYYTQGTEDIQSITLGGEPARSFDFFLSNDTERSHGIQVACIRGGTYFSLTFLAPEAEYAALQRLAQGVLQSFAFS